MERVLIDTNVIIVGARDYDDENETPESKILKMAMDNKLKIVLNPILLDEYHRVAADIVDKDFAGWFRNVIMKDLSTAYVGGEKMREFVGEFEGEIPSEDLPHFASCILTDADYLVSKNREFLKRAEGHGFECVSPGDFLEKTTETDHPSASRS